MVKGLDLCGLMEPTAGEVRPVCLTVGTVPGGVLAVLTAGMLERTALLLVRLANIMAPLCNQTRGVNMELQDTLYIQHKT